MWTRVCAIARVSRHELRWAPATISVLFFVSFSSTYRSIAIKGHLAVRDGIPENSALELRARDCWRATLSVLRFESSANFLRPEEVTAKQITLFAASVGRCTRL